jgi:hypothetical protein
LYSTPEPEIIKKIEQRYGKIKILYVILGKEDISWENKRKGQLNKNKCSTRRNKC